jgi:RHS repeat-associated protein
VHYVTTDVPSLAEGQIHVLLDLPDALGSTTVVIDRASAEVVEDATYAPFGATESDLRAERWDGFREDYRFTGKEEDVEVGLYYFGKRYDAPLLGRWVSADPLTIHSRGADPNAYSYVHGAVLKATDPHGLTDPFPPDPSRQLGKEIQARYQIAKTIVADTLLYAAASLAGGILGGPTGMGTGPVIVATLKNGTSGAEVALAQGGAGELMGRVLDAPKTAVVERDVVLPRADATSPSSAPAAPKALPAGPAPPKALPPAPQRVIPLPAAPAPPTPGVRMTNVPEPATVTPPRFVGEPNGTLVDTISTPPGRYIQPDGSATDVLQTAPHPDPNAPGKPTFSHTHEAKSNVNPKTGAIYPTGPSKDPTPVTPSQAANISDGTATPAPPKGR